MSKVKTKVVMTEKEKLQKEAVKKEQIDKAITGIMNRFVSGDVPQMIARIVFDSAPKPCRKWSLLNQLIVGDNNTSDARTFKQWQAVERNVVKGAKSFRIFAPCVYDKVEEDAAGNEVKVKKLGGYRNLAVFAVEETDGKELPGPAFEPQKLPLFERAEEWGISVKAEGLEDLSRRLSGLNAYGVYMEWSKLGAGEEDVKREEIYLSTSDPSVFFHELAHAAQRRIPNRRIERERHELYEIVAELSAAVLCEVTETSTEQLGNSYQYIEHHIKQANLEMMSALSMVLNDVNAVLKLIIFNDSKAEGSETPEVEC